MKYLVDSDCFIGSCRDYYHNDVCPGFLPWVLRENGSGRVFSTEHVRKELIDYEDGLATWARGIGPDFFLPPDQATVAAMKEIAQWVVAEARLLPTAKATYFSEKADQYLVGHAKAHGFCLVTCETSAPDSTRRLFIPDVCDANDVEWLPYYKFLRELKPGFVLPPDNWGDMGEI